MNDTRYTIAATRYGGACRFIRHDMDERVARNLAALMANDGYDRVTVTPPLPDDTLTPEAADALAKRGQERAVGCVVFAVCGVMVATMIFYGMVRGLTRAMTVRTDGIERNVDK